MVKDFKVFKRVTTALLSFALVISLSGCFKKEGEGVSSSDLSSLSSSDSAMNISESAYSSDSYVSTSESESSVSDSVSTEEKSASESVSEELDRILARASELKDTVKNSDAYKSVKEDTKRNFKEVVDFLFNGGEINGYTSSEVSSSVKEKAISVLNKLDGYIEEYIPDYKDRALSRWKQFKEYAEEKGTDVIASGYDKYQEIKEKVLKKTK